MLFPALADPTDTVSLTVEGRSLSYRELKAAGSAFGASLDREGRVAVWASPTLETCVAVIGALLAGAAVVPINPKIGLRDNAESTCEGTPIMLEAIRI